MMEQYSIFQLITQIHSTIKTEVDQKKKRKKKEEII